MPSEGNDKVVQILNYQAENPSELERMLKDAPEDAVQAFSNEFIRLHLAQRAESFVLVDYFTQLLAYHHSDRTEDIGTAKRIDDKSELIREVEKLKNSRARGKVYEIDTYKLYVQAKAGEN
jgi:hypothetical protein